MVQESKRSAAPSESLRVSVDTGLGRWALQYSTIRDVWAEAVSKDTGILMLHSPPALYG
jgi:hypothetical protein